MRTFYVAVLTVLLLSFKTTKAQMVTIPDPNFLIFLQNSDVAGCLTGNQLDASCDAVVYKYDMDCSNFNIADLTGIEAFVNLLSLTCSSDSLVNLPTLPPNLMYLDCSFNSLTDLPSLPDSIYYLACSHNQITNLPLLPHALEELWCNNNSLSTIYQLPPNLKYLNCYGNPLTSLPTLPSTLVDLNCGGIGYDNYENNPISVSPLTYLPDLPPSLKSLKCLLTHIATLPTLPDSLTTLVCGGWVNPYYYAFTSPLTNLPALPQTLTTLYCPHAHLSSLPTLPPALTDLQVSSNYIAALPLLPNSIVNLDCSDNLLSVLPTLPATLQTLKCFTNHLAGLPALPAQLTALNCAANQITAMPPLPGTLHSLNCWSNQLASLPLLPPTLVDFSCSYNHLTTLPTLPESVTSVYADHNLLTTVPNLPGILYTLTLNDNPNLSCLPPFEKLIGNQYFNIANTAITCLPNVIQHSGSYPAIDTMPLCGIFGNGCQVAWNVAGNVYRDDNVNCLDDSAESKVANVKVLLSQGGNVVQQVFTNGVGDYSFDTNLGTYDTRVDTAGLPFNILCPVTNTHSSSLIASDSLDFTADFALQCKPGYDLAVQSVCHTSGLFFPAHLATVSISAGDLALYYGVTCNTQGLSGTVTATFSGPVSVNAVSGNGLVAGNSVTWNVGDLSQQDFSHNFFITFLTDTIPATDQMCVSVSLNPSTGTDNNPSNNNLTQCFQVVNSFDPNVKEVYPKTASAPGDWLTYTVRFQNTGTAAAQHILVIDTLDANLDWSSFQLLAYSHPNLTQVKENGIVHFNFPNINLPDSTSDEPSSHGWIQYRIKTKSDVQPPVIIHNTASIYFDFNTPVVTNDAAVNYCVPSQTNQSFLICPGDSVHVGNHWYHQDGSYTDLFPSASGCDSSVITMLSVSSIDTALTVNGATVTATSNAVSYQWFNCDNGQPMPDDTLPTFTATQNGNYSVQLTYGNGCSITSSCVNVTGVNVASVLQGSFQLYPNPASQNVLLSHPAGLNALVVVTDLTGRRLTTQALSGGSFTLLSVDRLSAGTYRVQTTSNGKLVNEQKLVLIR